MSKLLNSDKKSAKVNNEQILLQNNSDDDKDFKSKINTPKELNKNSWLHSADNFGLLEKGRVL